MRLAVVNKFNGRKGWGFATVLDQFGKPTDQVVFLHLADAKWLQATDDTIRFSESRASSRWLKSYLRVGERIVLDYEMTPRGLRATQWAYDMELDARLDEFLRDYWSVTYRVFELDPETELDPDLFDPKTGLFKPESGLPGPVWEDDDCYTLSAHFPKHEKTQLRFAAQYLETIEYETPEGCGSYDESSDWEICPSDPRIDLNKVPPIIRELFGPRAQ